MSMKIKSVLRMQQIEEQLRKDAKAYDLELIQELATTRMGIPIELILAYDRAKKRYPNAIVRLENGVCRGCHLAASTGIALIAKAGTSIHICEHCSRLIYCEAPESLPKK
jgi:predicted  nucleic acid-binding Zn-ribbon protein